MKIPCKWNGIEYESISAAARACDISTPAMISRLASGHTQDSDVREHKVPWLRRPCVFEGVEYESVLEAARSNNVTHATMSRWLKHGRPKPAVVWDGKKYNSVADAARATGISPNQLSLYVERGYTTLSEAIQKDRERFAVVWNGVEYENKRALAKKLGVSPQRVSQYIQMGYTKDSDIKRYGPSRKSKYENYRSQLDERGYTYIPEGGMKGRKIVSALIRYYYNHNIKLRYRKTNGWAYIVEVDQKAS